MSDGNGPERSSGGSSADKLVIAVIAPVIVAAVSRVISDSLVLTVAILAVAVLVTALLLFEDVRRLAGRLWRGSVAVAGGAAGLVRRHRWRFLAGALTLTLIVIVGERVIDPPLCHGSLSEYSGVCVGITDGGDGPDVLGPRFRAVLKAIGKENERVEKSGQYVTIAFMGPLVIKDGDEDDNWSGSRVLHQAEGAFTAQFRANHESVGGRFPAIRLVLANQGVKEQQWERVTGRLAKMVHGPDHLVAVTGLGLSQDETLAAVRRLAKKGIPMAGDVITADGFDKTGAIDRAGGPIPGLYRVPYPVGRQLDAVAAELKKKRPDLRTALLVQDGSMETAHPDLYVKSLVAKFRSGPFGRFLKAGHDRTNPFGGENMPAAALDNQFSRISANLCGKDQPDLVFYAGRSIYLDDFLANLYKRGCSNQLIVVTGSDASILGLPEVAGRLREKVRNVPRMPARVVYAPLADVRDLAPLPSYQAFLYAFTKDPGAGRFPADHLLDGWAIMSHEALTAAAKATRNAVSTQKLPTFAEVATQLALFTSQTNEVPGATGSFQFDGTGNRAAEAPKVHWYDGP